MPQSGPLPFGQLVDAALAEIAAGAVAKGSKVHDLSVDFHGKTASTPFAPAGAAFAQDLVAGFLRGARILELDRAAEPLLDEYLLASMAIELLLASGEVPIDPGFDRLAFDVTLRASLVHDGPTHALLRGMADSRAAVDSLRADIPAAFEKFRTLAFRTRLSDTVTLASEPGLPPRAVDEALTFLLQGLGVSCALEIAPGAEAWSASVPVLRRAGEMADDLGLSFGVKARALDTVGRARGDFGDRFPIAFGGESRSEAEPSDERGARREAERPTKGGLTRPEIAEIVALGVSAVSVPLDGLITAVGDLFARMDAAGSAENLGDFVLKAKYGNGDAALEIAAKALGVDGETRRAAKAALAHSAPSAVVGADLYERWVAETRILNAKSLTGG